MLILHYPRRLTLRSSSPLYTCSLICVLMSIGHWSRSSFPLASSERTWWGKRKAKWCWSFPHYQTLISFGFELQSFWGAVTYSYINSNSHVSDTVCQMFSFSSSPPPSKPRNGVRVASVWRIRSWMRKCVSKWEANASTITPASPAGGWRSPFPWKVTRAAAGPEADLPLLAWGGTTSFSLLF